MSEGKAKFTPGPWGFYLSSNTGLPPDPIECIVINTIGLPIPSKQPAICIITDKESCNERDRANGLLIAAAPDMYAALEAVLSIPHFHFDCGDPACSHEDCEVTRMVHSALAKARREAV